MISLYRLALLSAWSRKASLFWVVLALGLGTLLMLGIEQLRTDTRSSFRQAVSGTDLIVGPRTSSVALLLFSVFRLGSLDQTIALKHLDQLSHHPNVAWIIPLMLGDSHHQFPVLGTTQDYFKHFRYGHQQALQLAQGQPFLSGQQGLFEAVIGSEVAERLHYELGQAIVLEHGFHDSLGADHTDKPFSIKGILAPTGTPVDHTVHISLESMMALHLDWVGGAPIPGFKISPQQVSKFDLQPKYVSAALMGLHQRAAVFALQRQITQTPTGSLMAILPGVALDELWNLLNIGETVLLGISTLVAGVSLLGMMAVILAGLAQRLLELSILRALGLGPWQMGLLLVLEGLALTLLGMAFGIILLAALGLGAAPWLQSYHGISLHLTLSNPNQWGVLAGVLVSGMMASMVPAYRAYRYALVSGLKPEV